jgi:hypothetical protein
VASIGLTEPTVDLARPFTPGRLKVYLTIATAQSIVTLVCAIAVGTGVLEPTRTVDVVANVFNFLPMIALPVAVFLLVEPGVRRDAELTLVWLPFTAAAQLSFELIWLIGQSFDVWKPTADPGWTWMWWQFALTDTRYFGQNPFIFGMELAAVVAACLVLKAFLKLIRQDLSDAERIQNLVLGLVGLTGLTVNTFVYFGSVLRNGMADVGQGDYGVGKLIALNGPYLVFPVLVLFAMARLIGHVAARAGSDGPTPALSS